MTSGQIVPDALPQLLLTIGRSSSRPQRSRTTSKIKSSGKYMSERDDVARFDHLDNRANRKQQLALDRKLEAEQRESPRLLHAVGDHPAINVVDDIRRADAIEIGLR